MWSILAYCILFARYLLRQQLYRQCEYIHPLEFEYLQFRLVNEAGKRRLLSVIQVQDPENDQK